MITFNSYKSTLLSNGANLSEVRRNNSNMIIDATFTNDTAYKRCKVLTSDGWKMVDAKYQKHTTPSILKDEVDYYLQFRPGVHFKLGTYVIVPDDTSPEINTPEDPFDQDYDGRTQWWLIVGRTNANQFVRYSILPCNWLFEWVYNGKIQSVYGCLRISQSYTSGRWDDEYSSSLDNLTSAWIPDVYETYPNYIGNKLDDTRTLNYQQRFMITDNEIYPKVYQVTKVVELVPKGIIKISLKQDEFSQTTDNVAYRICNYYDSNGDPLVDVPTPVDPDPSDPDVPTSTIHWCAMNDDGELEYADDIPDFNKNLRLNKTSYFLAEFSDEYNGQYIWKIKIDDELEDNYSDEDEERLSDYIQIVDFGDGSCSLKPNRVKELLGNTFILSVSDEEGGHYSTITMEVTA